MKTPLLALLLSLPVMAEDLPSIAAMKTAADAFLGSLDDAKRGQAVFPFEGDARENFKFTPQTRTGLPFKDMTEAQRAAATKLLDAALSEKGKLKATQIMTWKAFCGKSRRSPITAILRSTTSQSSASRAMKRAGAGSSRATMWR
jgi:hypothetical protein